MVVVKNLSRHYKVQEDALKTGRFGLGLMRRRMKIVNALENISFTVNKSEALGLIGLNGAGKSTLLKLLTGVLVPSSGQVLVGGLNPSADRKQNARQIGVVFGHRSQLWWDASLLDSMDVLRLIYSVDKDAYKSRLARLVELLELGDFMHRAPRQLSLGQRMRGEILASLLHSPKLLILDEPTIGLDIIAKVRIRALISSLVADEGVTVILASHEVSDIEQICDRSILIHQGEILYEGSIDDLKSGADVERSIVLDVSVTNENESEGTEIRQITVPLAGSKTMEALQEAAALGMVSDASVTGGSLETILAKMFDKAAR
jgi:ABC-2 type transport system ATP-binding protein